MVGRRGVAKSALAPASRAERFGGAPGAAGSTGGGGQPGSFPADGSGLLSAPTRGSTRAGAMGGMVFKLGYHVSQ